MAEGRPGPIWTRAALDEMNAAEGAAHAACDQAATVAALREEAAATVGFLQALSEQQLAERGAYLEGLPALTVAEWIERVLIGHPSTHLRSTHTAVEPEAT
jgi:hypothetical protein